MGRFRFDSSAYPESLQERCGWWHKQPRVGAGNLGAALALRRIGRYGLAVLDASPDFRHPGNSDRVGAGRRRGGRPGHRARAGGPDEPGGAQALSADTRYFGIRDCFEEEPAELAGLKIPVVTIGDLREWGAESLASVTRQAFEIPELDGFWVHLDADVLDPSVMPAVDSPDPDGLTPQELVAPLRPLLALALPTALKAWEVPPA